LGEGDKNREKYNGEEKNPRRQGKKKTIGGKKEKGRGKYFVHKTTDGQKRKKGGTTQNLWHLLQVEEQKKKKKGKDWENQRGRMKPKRGKRGQIKSCTNQKCKT